MLEQVSIICSYHSLLSHSRSPAQAFNPGSCWLPGSQSFPTSVAMLPVTNANSFMSRGIQSIVVGVFVIPLPKEKWGSPKTAASIHVQQDKSVLLFKKKETPLFQNLASLLLYFSWENWRLQIVYMGNVSCPHMKIYTSLRPKYLCLEIELTVSPADLLSTSRTTSNKH